MNLYYQAARYRLKLASKKKLKRMKAMYPAKADLLDLIYNKKLTDQAKPYIEFIAKWLMNREPVEDIISIAERFDNVKQSLENKDILSYKDFNTLVEKVVEQENKRKTKQLENKRDNIYEDDSFRVDIPHSFEAACILGKGTKWCITQKDDRGNPSYFQNYNEESTIFIISNPNATRDDRYGKMAILLDRFTGRIYEIRDRLDHSMSLKELAEILKDAYPKIAQIINQKTKEINKNHPVNYIMNEMNENVRIKFLGNNKFRVTTPPNLGEAIFTNNNIEIKEKDYIDTRLEITKEQEGLHWSLELNLIKRRTIGFSRHTVLTQEGYLPLEKEYYSGEEAIKQNISRLAKQIIQEVSKNKSILQDNIASIKDQYHAPDQYPTKEERLENKELGTPDEDRYLQEDIEDKEENPTPLSIKNI